MGISILISLAVTAFIIKQVWPISIVPIFGLRDISWNETFGLTILCRMLIGQGVGITLSSSKSDG